MFETSFLKQTENKVITDAIRAYRLFIKLVLLPHMPKVYPTYGVDLVWHTHQLLGADYKSVSPKLIPSLFTMTLNAL